MSIVLAYLVIVQIFTIYFFKDYNLYFLFALLAPLLFLFFNKKQKIFISCIVTIIVTSGICLLHNKKINTPFVKPQSSIRGEIISSPIIDGNKISFTFRLQDQKLLLNSFANTKSQISDFQKRKIGDICLLKGESSEPPANSNPFLFNYKNYLLNENIHRTFTTEPNSLVTCHSGKQSILQSLINSRQFLTKYVEDHFNAKTEGYINALLFGDRTKMSGETESHYQVVGIVHLLAISGSHISLLSVCIYYLLIRIGVTKENSLFITILCIVSYGFLAGASASVVRAVIIGVLVCLCKLAKKKIDIISLLFMSCIIMLLVKPNYVEDIGFQFSFFTSCVLVLTAKRIIEYKSWIGKAIFTSSITQLVSLPILLTNFYEISPYSIVLNMIFIPFITFIIIVWFVEFG